jgi:hypothetical protein
MRVDQGTVEVCIDCVYSIEYGMYDDLAEADRRVVNAGIARLMYGGVTLWAFVDLMEPAPESFTQTPCECCERPLAGIRYPVQMVEF